MAQRQARVRGFWIDPRFLVGVALVIVSIAGVYLLVAAIDRTTAVYAARSALVPGERIEAADLVVRNVRLGPSEQEYLAVNDLLDGAVATRSILAGELVPVSAVGTAEQAEQTIVVVSVPALAGSISKGSVVDLWASVPGRDAPGDAQGAPAVLVADATVAGIQKAAGIIADGRVNAVEVLVPRSRVAAVLEAIAADATMSIVPAAG